jgi:hypothetical protein
MLDTNQTSSHTPTTEDTPSTITVTPSLAIDANSVAGSVVQNVWKDSVDTGTAPSDLGEHVENDGGDARMHGLEVRNGQPMPSKPAVSTNEGRPALDRAYRSAAAPVIPAPATPADDLEEHKTPTPTSTDTHIIEGPSVPEVAASLPSASEPIGINPLSSVEGQTSKPLRQGYDVTTGAFYYFHEATPPPKPKQVEHETMYGDNGQEDVTMNEGEEDGEEEKSGGSTAEPGRSPSLSSSTLPGLMRTRRRPRISYAEPYLMRDSKSRSPSPAAPVKPKRTYGRRGSRQRSGSDGCPPPPTLRGGKASESFYIPLLPTNIQPLEGIKQMTMEQKTRHAMQLGGRPLRKKELVYIMECMDPDLKTNADRGWVVRNFAYISWTCCSYLTLSQNTLSQGNSVRKSSKSTKGKIELKTQVVSLESDYVTGYFWWLPGQKSNSTLFCSEMPTPPHYNVDTPHQCKPDDLFRERLGPNRRMDIRVSATPTPMEDVEKYARAQRPRRSFVPLLEEEDE